MLTRIARRYSGSLHAGVSSTASILSAAAERKIAPTFVGFTTFSSTAIRLASLQISCGVRSFGRYMAQSIPRVSLKPVSFASTSNSATYTGNSLFVLLHIRMASNASPSVSSCLFSISTETGTHPASNARMITFGLSAINIPFAGSARLTS